MVAPGASRPGVVGRHGDGWKLRVAAAPEHGKANEAVLALLAETLAVPRAHVSLVSGAGSRRKVVELAGLEPDEVERRLATAGTDPLPDRTGSARTDGPSSEGGS
jgi:uncharacterized protein